MVQIVYKCELCGESYATFQDALKCELKGVDKPVVGVGDIVLCHSGFGWFDGDRRWVENPDVEGNPNHDNCFAPCCSMQFFYVVTAINEDDRDGHRTRYHLFTKAMSGENGYTSGYTYNDGHYRPRKVAHPSSFIVVDSRDLMGKLAESLV